MQLTTRSRTPVCRRARLVIVRVLVSATCVVSSATVPSFEPARADEGSGRWTVGADTLVATDTDNVLVVSPQVSVRRTLDEDGSEVHARGVVDVVSAASVDVVSQATRGFHETREEASLGGSYAFGRVRPSLDYRFSTEPDYLSNGLRAGVLAELGSPDTVLSVSYGGTYDVIGRRGTPFSQWSSSLWTHHGDVSLTQTLGENTLVRGVYTLTVQDGYLAKIYRYVPLFTSASLERARVDGITLGLDNFNDYRTGARVPENVPDLRVGHAFGVRALQYLPPIDAALRLDAQVYVDSWGVVGFTAEPAVTFDLSAHVGLSVYGRLYTQTAASFWQRTYAVASETDVPRWRTLNRLLSPFTATTGGARFEWRNDWLALYVDAAVTYTHYSDYLFLDHKLDVVSLVGARWTP